MTYAVAGYHVSSGLDKRPDGLCSLIWYLDRTHNRGSASELDKIDHVDTH